ncbi:phospholipase D family protein [Serratia sp. JSRIV001]|uniref:phospholipase D family nuclease n=2 Tax=Serratia TaxID=613 RepID=UPI001CC02DB7|nr:phospholipase D family protein [Serratia sp. JSRIV001]
MELYFVSRRSLPSLVCLTLLSGPLLVMQPASATVEAAFTPGQAQTLVLDSLAQSRSSIELAAYSFTSKPVALALVDAQQRGVQVRVLADDKDSRAPYSAVTFLANQGVPVRLNSKYAKQHSKFVVVDGRTVQTGSANYTASAFSRNAENVVVIRDETAVARAYQQEFERLWAEGTPLNSNY